MKKPIPKCIAQGRIADTLLPLPESDRIAVASQHGMFMDYKVRVFPSRASLKLFLGNQTTWNAIIKDDVPPSMLVHPAYQRAKWTQDGAK